MEKEIQRMLEQLRKQLHLNLVFINENLKRIKADDVTDDNLCDDANSCVRAIAENWNDFARTFNLETVPIPEQLEASEYQWDDVVDDDAVDSELDGFTDFEEEEEDEYL